MFKVYVIIFGLSVIVPAEDGRSLTAILLKTDGLRSRGGTGEPFVPHQAQVIYRPSTPGSVIERVFAGEVLSFTPQGGLATRKLNLRESNKVPRLGAILESVGTAIRPGCLGAHPERDCTINGQELVAGRVRLEGGWTMKAIEIVEREPRPGLVDHSRWGFVSLGSGGFHSFEGEMANGFLFEISVPSLSAVAVNDGTASILAPEPSDICERYDPSAPDCAIVIVSNVGRDDHTQDTQHKADEIFDTHFEMVYYLLSNPFQEHFIPFLRFEEKRFESPGDPPGSRCFGVFAR